MIPDEREWQAQEFAMRCERAGMEMTASDALAAAYLPIVKALDQSLDPLLPADFAVRVAAMAAARRYPEVLESRLERLLLIGLASVFGFCALAAFVIYGGSWLANSAGMLAQIGISNLSWPIVLGACLAVSWFSEAVRRRPAAQVPNPA